MPLSLQELEKKLKEIKFNKHIQEQQKEYTKHLENLQEEDLIILKQKQRQKK